MRPLAFALIVLCSSPAAVVAAQAPPAQAPAAQAPKPQTPAPAPAAPPQTPATAVPPPLLESYTYNSEGRRDPFLSLLGSGETHAVSHKGEGPTGMTVAEISVRGIVMSRGALVAMIQGPDGKTYLVHEGDKFVDGTIKSINTQGLVISQAVNDPLSLVKQREIKKMLRSSEDAKE